MDTNSIATTEFNPREMAIIQLYSLGLDFAATFEALNIPRTDLFSAEEKVKYLLALPTNSSWSTIANAFSEINNMKNTIGRG